jgi:hypothetical protein
MKPTYTQLPESFSFFSEDECNLVQLWMNLQMHGHGEKSNCQCIMMIHNMTRDN